MTTGVASQLCLTCRQVVVAGACDPPDHQLITLDAAGRERLDTAMRGSRAERLLLEHRRARRSQRIGGVGGVAALAASLVTVLSVPSRELALLVGGAIGLLGAGVTSLIDRRPQRRVVGAVDRPPAPPFARGTIVAARGDDLRSPASGLWCAGWALELSQGSSDAGATVLRDATTAGLDIRLDGGARARVPAGPWHPAGELVTLLDLDELALTAHLRVIDPRHRGDDPLEPLHHDVVHEALLHVGDRVELCGAWRPVPDDRADGDPSLYRDAPATVLIPSRWPTLRRV